MNIGADKRPTMYVLMLVMWLLTISWFDPRLLALTAKTTSLYGKAITIVFILYLDVFWLFGTYYLLHFVFTKFSRRRKALPLSADRQPRVAVLYLTMNDFDREAAVSCVRQNYANYHTFLLDDSTRPETIAQVDGFHKEFSSRTTIVRRLDRNGFKAGSINHAMRTVVRDFEYFAVVDSDGVIPENFLEDLVPYFFLDPHLGFLQGSNEPNPHQKSEFASDLALGITPLWTSYFGPRNDFGFVPFLGHSGMIRRDVWEQVGGIPELVSEDLAFSTRACELGYRGAFVKDVVSLEDFPQTYQQLRKQQEKYVKGGCQFLHTCLGSFLRSSTPRWFEKLDVIMSCGTLFLPSFHLVFVIVLGVLLARVLGTPRPLTMVFGHQQILLWNAYVLDDSFRTIWHWDFYLITIVNMFAPMLGCVALIRTASTKLLRLIMLSAIPYLSLMVTCTVAVLSYLVTKKAVFLVTADQSDGYGFYACHPDRTTMLDGVDQSHPIVHFIELVTGTVLSVLCLRTLNIALFAFCLCLILGPLLLRYGWNCRLIRICRYVPFILILSSMGLLGTNLVGAQSVFWPLFCFHF